MDGEVFEQISMIDISISYSLKIKFKKKIKLILIPPTGLEPAIRGLGGRCLIHLATKASGCGHTKNKQIGLPLFPVVIIDRLPIGLLI